MPPIKTSPIEYHPCPPCFSTRTFISSSFRMGRGQLQALSGIGPYIEFHDDITVIAKPTWKQPSTQKLFRIFQRTSKTSEVDTTVRGASPIDEENGSWFIWSKNQFAVVHLDQFLKVPHVLCRGQTSDLIYKEGPIEWIMYGHMSKQFVVSVSSKPKVVDLHSLHYDGKQIHTISRNKCKIASSKFGDVTCSTSLTTDLGSTLLTLVILGTSRGFLVIHDATRGMQIGEGLSLSNSEIIRIRFFWNSAFLLVLSKTDLIVVKVEDLTIVQKVPSLQIEDIAPITRVNTFKIFGNKGNRLYKWKVDADDINVAIRRLVFDFEMIFPTLDKITSVEQTIEIRGFSEYPVMTVGAPGGTLLHMHWDKGWSLDDSTTLHNLNCLKNKKKRRYVFMYQLENAVVFVDESDDVATVPYSHGDVPETTGFTNIAGLSNVTKIIVPSHLTKSTRMYACGSKHDYFVNVVERKNMRVLTLSCEDPAATKWASILGDNFVSLEEDNIMVVRTFAEDDGKVAVFQEVTLDVNSPIVMRRIRKNEGTLCVCLIANGTAVYVGVYNPKLASCWSLVKKINIHPLHWEILTNAKLPKIVDMLVLAGGIVYLLFEDGTLSQYLLEYDIKCKHDEQPFIMCDPSRNQVKNMDMRFKCQFSRSINTGIPPHSLFKKKDDIYVLFLAHQSNIISFIKKTHVMLVHAQSGVPVVEQKFDVILNNKKENQYMFRMEGHGDSLALFTIIDGEIAHYKMPLRLWKSLTPNIAIKGKVNGISILRMSESHNLLLVASRTITVCGFDRKLNSIKTLAQYDFGVNCHNPHMVVDSDKNIVISFYAVGRMFCFICQLDKKQDELKSLHLTNMNSFAHFKRANMSETDFEESPVRVIPAFCTYSSDSKSISQFSILPRKARNEKVNGYEIFIIEWNFDEEKVNHWSIGLARRTFDTTHKEFAVCLGVPKKGFERLFTVSWSSCLDELFIESGGFRVTVPMSKPLVISDFLFNSLYSSSFGLVTDSIGATHLIIVDYDEFGNLYVHTTMLDIEFITSESTSFKICPNLSSPDSDLEYLVYRHVRGKTVLRVMRLTVEKINFRYHVKTSKEKNIFLRDFDKAIDVLKYEPIAGGIVLYEDGVEVIYDCYCEEEMMIETELLASQMQNRKRVEEELDETKGERRFEDVEETTELDRFFDAIQERQTRIVLGLEEAVSTAEIVDDAIREHDAAEERRNKVFAINN